MNAVDRANYIPELHQLHPYVDSPVPIGCGQTISAPHMHKHALELLFDQISKPNAKVLDVGSGSGLFTVLAARLNPSATIYGIDCFPELVNQSIANISKSDRELLDTGRVRFYLGNGWKGLAEHEVCRRWWWFLRRLNDNH